MTAMSFEGSLAVAPKYRQCKTDGCDEEAASRRQLCYEHWMAKQPPVARSVAAERRLALVPEHLRSARVSPKKWPEGRRFCSGCQTFVLLDQCSGSQCRDCSSLNRYMTTLRNEFGIDPSTYQWLLEMQLGRCAICRQRPVSKRLAVDHDHTCCPKPPTCGKCIRGLLCSTCNHDLLGAAYHSADILQNAQTYLRRPPFTGDWPIPSNELEEWRTHHGDTAPAPF
jgi:hypothetical protein